MRAPLLSVHDFGFSIRQSATQAEVDVPGRLVGKPQVACDKDSNEKSASVSTRSITASVFLDTHLADRTQHQGRP